MPEFIKVHDLIAFAAHQGGNPVALLVPLTVWTACIIFCCTLLKRQSFFAKAYWWIPVFFVACGVFVRDQRRLCRLVPPQPCRLMYVQHRERRGIELFETVCRYDLEGIVAKWAAAPYATEPPSWVKIKNPAYSQAVGRREKFEAFRQASAR